MIRYIILEQMNSKSEGVVEQKKLAPALTVTLLRFDDLRCFALCAFMYPSQAQSRAYLRSIARVFTGAGRPFKD